MVWGKRRINRLRTALAGVALAAAVSQGSVCAAEDSTEETWSDDYRAMRSILDTHLMEKGVPQTLGVGSIVYKESPAVTIISENSGMTVVSSETVTAVEPAVESPAAKPAVESPAAKSLDQGTVYIEDDDPNAAGPSVQKVTLEETYYPDYEIYSESVAGCCFFYTNTGNNSITDQTVYVDIPANILYTVQKDGVDISYTSSKGLSEMGTYVFQMTVVKNPDAPIVEQEIYQAVYNFRIQPKAQTDTADEASVEETQADTAGETVLEETQADTAGETVLEETQTAVLMEEIETGNREIEEMTGQEETSPETQTAAGGAVGTPPACEIERTDNGVKIHYDADDVVEILLSDGNTQTYYESISEVTAAGDYTLYLYDAAGNVNEVSFRIKGRINMATVLFIVMLAALIAAGVVYYRRTRSNLNLK